MTAVAIRKLDARGKSSLELFEILDDKSLGYLDLFRSCSGNVA